MAGGPGRRRLGGDRQPELVLAGALGIAAAVTLVILRLVAAVATGSVATLDRGILLAFRQATGGTGPMLGILKTVMLDLTGFGDLASLVIIVALVAGYLVAIRRPRLSLFLVAEIAAGIGLVWLLKGLVDRGRPDVVTHLANFHGASFPSGHAAESAIVYLSLAILLGRVAPTRAARLYVMAAAAGLTVAIGLSRVYLGVHWPSDVLAGWVIGSGWALVVALLAQWMRLRRGRG